jgi:O-antigen/teichoic acid export membrane protein
LAFGVKVMPGQLADLANSRLDQLLVAPYLGAADLGIYAVAAAVTTVPTMVGTSLAWDAFSRVSRSDPAGRTNPASAAIRRAWLACSGVALAAAVIVVLLFVPIFGEAYRRGQAAALILLVGSVALAVNLVAQQVAIALGRPQYVSWSQALGFAVTVAGLPFAIPTLGIGGAALVSTIAYSARLGLMLVLLRRDGATHIAPRWQDTVELARSVRQRLSGLRAPTPT